MLLIFRSDKSRVKGEFAAQREAPETCPKLGELQATAAIDKYKIGQVTPAAMGEKVYQLTMYDNV